MYVCVCARAYVSTFTFAWDCLGCAAGAASDGPPHLGTVTLHPEVEPLDAAVHTVGTSLLDFFLHLVFTAEYAQLPLIHHQLAYLLAKAASKKV
jgi:hypothetical protein